MPLYDVECKECGKVFEYFCKIADSDSIKCKCGGLTKILITCCKSKDWFQPHWSPNFGLEPVYVKSRNHFKQLCLKHNVSSRVLGDYRTRNYDGMGN